MSNRKLYKEAIETFGGKAQTELLVEECSGLILALQRYKKEKHRKSGWAGIVAEKVGDVEIVCGQMRLLFPDIPKYKKHKLESLEARIQKAEDTREQADRDMAAEGSSINAWNPNKGGNQ